MRIWSLALFALLASSPLLLAQLNIVINPGAGLSSNAPALAAFNRAAAEWTSRLRDPITVNISADLSSAFANANIIGSASNVALAGGFDLIRNAMVADAADESDDAIVGFLPTSGTFTASLRTGTSLNGTIVIAKANLKALGFAGLDAQFGNSDATITFNQAFSFDYDRSDGITPGTIDFQTVAAHEIGHALGFTSAVDDSDGGATSYGIQPLDLFRFGLGAIPTDSTQFATLARELRPGFEAITSDTIDNYRMSTGQSMGDGRQASHWKDDALGFANIGLLDPTLASGIFTTPSEADLRAFDLIGYEFAVVPEPSTFALVAFAGAAMCVVARRRRTAS